MRFAIYGRFLKVGTASVIQEVFDLLEELKVEYFVYQSYFETIQHEVKIANIQTFANRNELLQLEANFLITLGGDGTILNAPLLVKDASIPVAGINLGRLGFLTGIDRAAIKAGFAALIEGNYKIEKRTLLELSANFPMFQNKHFALNDCTIAKRDTSSMITIHAYLNGEYLNAYWADGLIISTPTGSTGYSLSCGGPIVFPNSGNFVLTPIAPHNLNVRPLVISDTSELSFEIEGRADNYLCTLDSRFELITTDHRITLKKANFDFQLVRLPNTGFLSAIRSKLAWGMDKRN